jgi:hypothetical protein
MEAVSSVRRTLVGAFSRRQIREGVRRLPAAQNMSSRMFRAFVNTGEEAVTHRLIVDHF